MRNGLGRYASDLWRVLGADKFASDLTSAADQPEVYVYRFNWGSPNEDGRSPLPGDFGATLGAHHGMEITFVLGNAIVFDVDLLDSSAKITVDTELWTVDSVLAQLDEDLVEPTRSAVLALLKIIGWI